MTTVLVTGANGFVGRTMCRMLSEHGLRVRAALRSQAGCEHAAETAIVGNIGPGTEWEPALAGVDTVVHLAARTHVLNDTAGSDAYFDTNTAGTLRLGDAAVRAGVRRFVFLSSIKVNGEQTRAEPFTADDVPAPLDAYGESKWRAEQGLLDIAAKSSLGMAIVRTPLVYGPGVRANFLRLMHMVRRGVPLPFGALNNERSLIGVWNLCDLLLKLTTMPRLPAHTFLVSDGHDLSTPELIRLLAAAMGRRARLVNVPPSWLRAAGRVTGRGPEIARLCDSLRVDVTGTRRLLGWEPPMSVEEGLARTARWLEGEGAT
jgi:nucleoside-diphosphate-sugar epimerase